VQKEVEAEEAEAAENGPNTNVVITFKQRELQAQLGRVVRGHEKVVGEISRLFAGETQAPVQWTQNQLDMELATAQHACFVDFGQCVEYVYRWGLLNEALALSELRLGLIEQLLEVLRAVPASLLRCHSIDTGRR
jgi:hypothetical protein